MTIKEKAVNYASGKWSADTIEFDYCEESYKDGAYVVLKEIEKCLQGDLSLHSFLKLKCIKQIIDELKGE